ncbi:family 43 glycosylhydrolase [Neolewinella lacunae]|uniref:Family 43 glycosylhydrolase n=1 Tax=Neolewinella lacunae TaxID=1517758 RepID=A0A923PHM7_9BACT|nr:family 43 glycosylhydrolase [Neolewinella lacunae]MBC6994245.1 family 43 glycosylhydrolase [Neolewinella lacunae]MDN3637137.1 family 43 glycosylhydrolase [Neolewinella lacunae]
MLLLLFAGCASSPAERSATQTSNSFTYQNPIRQGINPQGLRDCQVFWDGGYWYLTGTSYPHWSRQESGPESYNKGVVLYRSTDLLTWEDRGYVVKAGGADKWYHRRFWAPEIHRIGGKYYALFNARNDSLGYASQFTGYAVADQVEGPYTVVTEDQPLTNGNDLTFFEDDDGKVWAFWNRGREFGIGFAEIDLATATLKTEPTTAIQPAAVDFAYDASGQPVLEPNYDGTSMKPKVAKYHDWDAIGIEGAYVIKEKDTYYLFYSSWTRGYEIGYASAPAITGPWTKAENNPFYGAQSEAATAKNGFAYTGDADSPFNQVGHNEIFLGPDGRYWLSCHGILKAEGEEAPLLVIDPLTIQDGKVTAQGPTYTPQTVKW